MQFLIFPFYDAKEKISRSLLVNEKTLADLVSMGSEYSFLKKESERVQKVLSRRPQDFTLFSYLDKKAGEVGVKANIKYMNSLKGKTVGTYEETTVDMQLEKVTLKQAADFLYFVELPQDLIKIRKITIQKMKESPEYLSVSLQVITYQPSRGELSPIKSGR